MRIPWPTVVSVELHALVVLLLALPSGASHAATSRAVDDAATKLVDVMNERDDAPTRAAYGAVTVAPSIPKAAVVHRTSSKRPGEPPPPAARAGEVLVVDRANETVVRDVQPSHAGGVTQEGATSPVPTYDPNARAWGIVGGTGSGGGGLGMLGRDLSRPARLGGPKYWDCPFPAEAAGIDQAVVRAQAEVLADGTPVRITTLDDPGYGFAREAVPCAMKERYVPALDRTGRPIRAVTQPFRVVFAR